MKDRIQKDLEDVIVFIKNVKAPEENKNSRTAQFPVPCVMNPAMPKDVVCLVSKELIKERTGLTDEEIEDVIIKRG